MPSVLFVCLGNICRSPMAETILAKMVEDCGLADQFEIDSAGLIDYHEGECADDRMRRHASMHGYYITHRSRPIRPDDFSRFDYIIGMDRQNMRALRSMQPPGNHARLLPIGTYLTTLPLPEEESLPEVPDPYYGGDCGFEHVIALLERACTSLLDSLSA